MLDTIRQLTQAMKLKDLIISNFIPDDFVKSIEKRSSWNQEEDNWIIQKMDLSGNKLRSMAPRPISNPKHRRPESDYARQRYVTYAHVIRRAFIVKDAPIGSFKESNTQ